MFSKKPRKGGYADRADNVFFRNAAAQMNKMSRLGRKNNPNSVSGILGFAKSKSETTTSVNFVIDVVDMSAAKLSGMTGKWLSNTSFELNVFTPKPKENSGDGPSDAALSGSAIEGDASQKGADGSDGSLAAGTRKLLGTFEIRQGQEIRVGIYVGDNAALRKTLLKISTPGEVRIDGLTIKPNKKDLTQWFLNASDITATNRFSTQDTFHLMNGMNRRGLFHPITTQPPSLEECYQMAGINAGDPWPEDLTKRFKQSKKKSDEKKSLEERIVMHFWRQKITDQERETMNAKIKLHPAYDEEYEFLNPEDGSRGFMQDRPVIKDEGSFSMKDQNDMMHVFFRCWMAIAQWDEGQNIPKDKKQHLILGLKVPETHALNMLGTRNKEDYKSIAPYVLKENDELDFPVVADCFLDVETTLGGCANTVISDIEQSLEYVATNVYTSMAMYVIAYGLPVTLDFVLNWIQEEYDLNFEGPNQNSINLKYADEDVKEMIKENELQESTKGNFINVKEYDGKIGPELAKAYNFYVVPNFHVSEKAVENVVKCAETHDERAEIISSCLKGENQEMVNQLGLTPPRRIKDLRVLIFGVAKGKEETLCKPPKALEEMFSKLKASADAAKDTKSTPEVTVTSEAPSNESSTAASENIETTTTTTTESMQVTSEQQQQQQQQHATEDATSTAPTVMNDSDEEEMREQQQQQQDSQGLLSPGSTSDAHSGSDAEGDQVSASETEDAETGERRRRRKHKHRSKRHRDGEDESHRSSKRRRHTEDE